MACNRRSFIVLAMVALLPLVISIRVLTETKNGFKEGDRIPLFANTVHYVHFIKDHNLCDIYPYFEFAFCPPGDPIYNRKKTFREILTGDCFTPTQYELKFKVGTVRKVLCEKNLTKDEVSKFRYAVTRRLIYHMHYNSIMFVGGTVGTLNDSGTYLVTHIDFYPHYYDNQVTKIYARVEEDSVVDITEDTEIKVNFTYSVFWEEFNINQENSALRKAVKDWLPPAEPEVWTVVILSFIHWAVIILLWLGLLLAIPFLCLRSYCTRYSQGNVISCPPYPSLLGAILGNGIQHLIVICTFLVMAYIDVLYPCKPGSVYSNLLLAYCLSSVVSGYKATSFHARYSAQGWKECVFQTGVLYLVPVFLNVLVINTLGKILYDHSVLPEFGIVVVLFITWGPGTVIFLTLGVSIGYSFKVESQEHSTTRRTRSPKDIPQQSWWMRTPAQMFLGGLIPFMTIFRDMDEIYASLWNLKVCGAFSSLFTAFLLVIIMTILVGMGYTYHQLSRQDLHWWWRSVLRGGSTAIYMFAYGIYFHSRLGIKGLMKLLIFLGYNACIFYSFFLVLGTIGFFASSAIAHRMYPGLKKGPKKHE